MKKILHLCADVGSDSMPYKEAGYEVILVGRDVGIENFKPPSDVHGIIANPPCTHFSIARTRATTPRDLREGMRLVKECLRVIWECQYNIEEGKLTTKLKWWALENPATGMLKDFLGKPAFMYCPSEYGAPFTKRTALWGKFSTPQKPFFLSNPLRGKSLVGDVVSLLNYPKGKEGKIKMMNDRSTVYEPFAKAFFYANP